LDLMMPVMDGFAVLEALRNDERTDSVPVLVLAAIATDHTAQQCYNLGARGVHAEAIRRRSSRRRARRRDRAA
jgi:CheY-like chemotaxis protein